TMIQRCRLEEKDYRGARFAGHPRDLKNNNDIITLVRPDIIAAIHAAYLDAGADIIETNTFQANAIDMAHFGVEHLVYELNRDAARIARAATETAMEKDPSRPRFVAGALGPLTRMASQSPDVNDPGARAVTFRQLVEVYAEQVRGLMDGGVDLLL